MRITKFNDKKLADCTFYFEVIKSFNPEIVNDEQVTSGHNEEKKKHNA